MSPLPGRRPFSPEFPTYQSPRGDPLERSLSQLAQSESPGWRAASGRSIQGTDNHTLSEGYRIEGYPDGQRESCGTANKLLASYISVSVGIPRRLDAVLALVLGRYG